MELKKFLKTNCVFLIHFNVKIYLDGDFYHFLYDKIFDYSALLVKFFIHYSICSVSIDFFNKVCFISIFKEDSEE